MRRVILHIDMDAFFAQIEERENPQFKGKPVIVGADPKGGNSRGVVSTANYVARKYGIHSALPISKAYELCPEAIFLPVNMALYQKVSQAILTIVKKFSPKWEIVSLDEAYLDLTEYSNILKTTTHLLPEGPEQKFGREEGGSESQASLGPHLRIFKEKVAIEKCYQRVENLAKKLKNEIFKKEKLTSTVGIGPNKLIAKMAAERAKPDGLLMIKPNQVEKFLEPLDIEDLPGIGPKTAEKLRAIGINKIKELKKLSKSKLKDMFGKVWETIYEKARGINEEPVSSEEIIKSIGKEHTFEKDTRDSEMIFGTFEKIIKDVHKELLGNSFSFKTITVVCRFSGFETHTKSKTLKSPTNDFEILKAEAKKLLLKFLIENPKLIRLIGLRIKIF